MQTISQATTTPTGSKSSYFRRGKRSLIKFYSNFSHVFRPLYQFFNINHLLWRLALKCPFTVSKPIIADTSVQPWPHEHPYLNRTQSLNREIISWSTIQKHFWRHTTVPVLRNNNYVLSFCHF